MLKRRITCILLILSALILYFFDNETVTLALLVSLIVMPAVSIGLLALSGKHLGISMQRNAEMEGQIASGKAAADKDRNDSEITAVHPVMRVSIENPDIIPIATVESEIVCENLRTGEADSYNVTCRPRPRSTQDIDLEIIPEHAGRYSISVANAVMSDPLQLVRRDTACHDREYITVLPETFDMQLTYASDAAMLENDRSTDSRRGNDPGEVRAIREYVAGDPVRNIHWKLSEKMDKLLVKELGTPITDQFLVIFDTGHEISRDPVALEATASVFMSLVETLRRDCSGLSIGWTDPETGKAVFRRINNKEDITAAADEFLAVPASMHSAFRHIERDISESRYAHIIFVGSMIPEGIEAIANGCMVTVLLCGETGTWTESNVTITGFEPRTAREDLAGIEV